MKKFILRCVCATAVLTVAGCWPGGHGLHDDATSIVTIDLLVSDTVVDYRIGDTLRLDIRLSNPQDSTVALPIAGPGFSLSEPLVGEDLEGELFFIQRENVFYFSGCDPSITTDPVLLMSGQDTVVSIGFLPSTKIVAGLVALEHRMAFDWRAGHDRVRYHGVAPSVLRLLCRM